MSEDGKHALTTRARERVDKLGPVPTRESDSSYACKWYAQATDIIRNDTFDETGVLLQHLKIETVAMILRDLRQYHSDNNNGLF